MTTRRMGEVSWPPGQRFVPWPPPTGGMGSVGEPGGADVLILAPPTAWAHPAAPQRLAQAFADGADVVFGDVVTFDGEGRREAHHLGGFDLTQLMGRDCVGPLLALRGEVLRSLAGPRPEAGRAQLYDLALRAALAGKRVRRLAAVLTAVPEREAFASPAECRAPLEAALRLHDPGLHVRPGRTPGSLSLWRDLSDPPPVTLVAPTMQAGPDGGRAHVLQLLDSLERTDWPHDRLDVLVGDDTGDESAYRDRDWPFRLRVVPTPRPAGQPFNYAAKMNGLWRQSRTEHLVLLNDDVVASSLDWLRALMTFAIDPTVGAVGARLLFPDGRIQHAGVMCGLLGPCAHPWFGLAGDQPTYASWAVRQREWSAVTGAVLATRMGVLEAVAGFDEAFSLDFNDIDLCLKMRTLGLRVVYNPEAELIHRERSSRGQHRPRPEEMFTFSRRWQAWVDADPAAPPQMSRRHLDLRPVLSEEPPWLAGCDPP